VLKKRLFFPKCGGCELAGRGKKAASARKDEALRGIDRHQLVTTSTTAHDKKKRVPAELAGDTAPLPNTLLSSASPTNKGSRFSEKGAVAGRQREMQLFSLEGGKAAGQLAKKFAFTEEKSDPVAAVERHEKSVPPWW